MKVIQGQFGRSLCDALVIEVEVHQQLQAFLRDQGEPYWPHHLTMGRLVARALRLGRSVLIQTGTPPIGDQGRYRLSYLVSILLWSGPVILVATEAVQQRLLRVEIPQLQQWVKSHKAIQVGDRFPHLDFQGLLLTTPQAWLGDRFGSQQNFPSAIPTLIDGVDDLETWAREQLTVTLESRDWDELMWACPAHRETIRDARVQLTRAIFQHPANPYDCYLLEDPEREILLTLYHTLGIPLTPHPEHPMAPDAPCQLPIAWQRFWQQLQAEITLTWTTVNRTLGQFSLLGAPVDVAGILQPLWSQQPVVLMGSALDLDSEATIYRQRIGLEETMTCLKFAPDRQNELIHLYIPDKLPLPNTPQYQPALLHEIRKLLVASSQSPGFAVIVVGDVPLKAQVGAILASEFGSRVQVEKTCLDDNGILVTGWEFWRHHQAVLPTPSWLAIATLPLPSLEHPLVAGRVAHYKRQRQDWFRLYLLPTALSELQRAIAPIRETQGFVALLDSRILHRSYGQQVLSALSPLARTSYLDTQLFNAANYSIYE